MKTDNEMVVRVRWEEDAKRAVLWCGNAQVADIVEHRAGFECRFGCYLFRAGGITKHDSLAAAKAHVEGVLGIERIGGDGE